jgi:diguanylate cyclase (GGDEF)-like protein
MEASSSGRSRRVASAIRWLFAPSPDPYAGADLENAKRLGAALWLIGAGIAVVLLPFTPPTSAIGDAGWFVAAVMIVVCLAGVRRIKGEGTGFGLLLVVAYVGIAEIAALQWLAGGQGAPYEQLYLLAFIYCSTSHPPRRAVVCLGVGSVAFLAPLAYDGFSYGALVRSLTQLLIWGGICFVGMVLMSRVRQQRLEGRAASRLARVDSLTGLGNRRAFEEAVAREIALARRSGTPLSLLIVDIDDFKQINDRHGHTVGDRCLRKFGEALRLTVRTEDMCFRWGGDEFVALLPETGLQGARLVGDRLSETVRAARLGPRDTPLEISCGLSELSELSSPQDLVASADADLLLGKRASRAADWAGEESPEAGPTVSSR